MTNTIDKIKPLSLYLRNHTEPHDRGITYRLHDIMGVDCVAILKHIGLGAVNKPSAITAGQLSDSFEGHAVYGASGIAGYVRSFQHEQSM
jgi:hypothetical protein